MIPAPKPENEHQRIAALYEYNILDSIPEKEYDDITRIAAEICGMPMSSISIIDRERQWFKSRVGLNDPETSRDLSFCAHAILEPENIFIIKNAATDERFSDNPLVTGEPNIAFYAGVPLINDTGNALGTLCVLDNKPNELTKEQKETLKALARQVVAAFEVRKKNNQLREAKQQLEQVNQDLSKFAYVIAHDIKSPCSSLAMSVTFIKEAYYDLFDTEGKNLLEMMDEVSHSAIKMVDGILEHTRTINNVEVKKEEFTFGEFGSELKKLLVIPAEFCFEVNDTTLPLFTSKYMLLQVLLNLCNNAIKYNDKQAGKITVSASDEGSHYKFSVTDNGPGISPENQARIFDLFTTLNSKDRFNNKGFGIGLSTVKRIVEKMGGAIQIESEMGKGSSFIFTFGK